MVFAKKIRVMRQEEFLQKINGIFPIAELELFFTAKELQEKVLRLDTFGNSFPR